ncbi:MAG: Omp28 family outer membrane lipoprotein [Tannerella sp.]|jgi:hypothetical protein|nr:Omp28 family outer membrane lipoprotein [Tannerella sp.]
MYTKRALMFFIPALICAGSGCNDIDNRIIKMDEVIPLKKVLLLDFTDQNCPYCSYAGAEVAKLKERYGDNLVPVAIHSHVVNYPLVTKEGNSYDIYFRIREIGHPCGVIDGKVFPNYDQWGGALLPRFNRRPSLEINITSLYKDDSREVNLTTRLKGLREITHAKLLLWIVEDSIVSKQLLPEGRIDDDYLHRHVFRAVVSDDYLGEMISLKIGEETVLNHSYVLNEAWKAKDISIVGFVYAASTNEVFDVNEIELLK